MTAWPEAVTACLEAATARVEAVTACVEVVTAWPEAVTASWVAMSPFAGPPYHLLVTVNHKEDTQMREEFACHRGRGAPGRLLGGALLGLMALGGCGQGQTSPMAPPRSQAQQVEVHLSGITGDMRWLHITDTLNGQAGGVQAAVPVRPQIQITAVADARGTLQVSVEGLDAGQRVLARGQGSVQLDGAAAQDLAIALSPETVALSGAFAAGSAAGAAGGVALVGHFAWPAALRGSQGGISLEGALR